MTPCEAMYSQAPPTITSYVVGTSKVQEADSLLVTQDNILHLLKDNLHNAQHHIKQHVDQ